MSAFSSYKKIFLLGFIIVMLVAIPFSVYIAQKSQNMNSKASASTILSFEPALATIKTGDTVALNIMLDPGTGATANQVSFVKLTVNFDPAKFATLSADSLAAAPPPNTLTTVIEDPKYETGKAIISLSIGADPTNVVVTKTKIAILKLRATAATAPVSPNIMFDTTTPGATQVLSIASGDLTGENVLSTTDRATVTVTSATASSVPTSAPTPTLRPNTTGSPAPILTLEPVLTSTPTPTMTPTETPIPTLAIQPTLPPTGNGEVMFGLGTLGVIFTIVGGALLLL